jgi:ribose 5-phosphate isomerase B
MTGVLPVVRIATDHAGFELSAFLSTALTAEGYDVIDHGPKTYDSQDDYPAFCIDAARAVMRDHYAGERSLGIVIGGSGNGELIAANKVDGIRAALVWSEEIALLARQHNDANVIAIGARRHTSQECLQFVRAFLREPFSAETRHARRIDQIREYERTRLSQ